jgi:hypothetical protein
MSNGKTSTLQFNAADKSYLFILGEDNFIIFEPKIELINTYLEIEQKYFLLYDYGLE